jgi:hypothetical protein
MTDCNGGIGARRGGSGVSPDNRERSRSNEKPDRPQRVQALGWFFTYPQCPAIKEFLVDFLLKSFKVKEYVVASEKHEDGSPHLHAFVKVEKKISFKPIMGDFIHEGVTYHGNYQVAKCWRAVQKYCIKEGDYLSNIDVKSAISKEGKKLDLSKVVNGEMTLTDYVDADASRIMSLGKLQQGLAIYKALKEREKPDCVGSIPNSWGVENYNYRLIYLFMDQQILKVDANSVTIGFGQGDQIVVRPLSSSAYRLTIDAPSILVWRPSSQLEPIANLSSSTNTLGQEHSPRSNSTKWQMGRTCIPSKVVCRPFQVGHQCSSCAGTNTPLKSTRNPGPSSKPDSTSKRSSPKLRRTDTSYHLGKRDPNEQKDTDSDDDWICSITNNDCRFFAN